MGQCSTMGCTFSRNKPPYSDLPLGYIKGQLGFTSIEELVNLLCMKELSYDRCMTYSLIENYLQTGFKPGYIRIHLPNCASNLLYWETLAKLMSQLLISPEFAKNAMIWRTITDAKGNPTSLEEVTRTLLFPVQLYIDPHFHLDRTLDSFGVSSWEDLQAAFSK